MLNVREEVGGIVERAPKMYLPGQFKLMGHIQIEHWRDGKRIAKYQSVNEIKTLGKDHILDVCFGNSTPLTQIDPWYIGLIDDDGAVSPLVADTMASHTGWTEITGYDEAVRQTWADTNSSSGAKTSTSVATFTINATDSVWGIFITSNNTKGGTSGILWSTGAFAAVLPVVSADLVKVTYGLSI